MKRFIRSILFAENPEEQIKSKMVNINLVPNCIADISYPKSKRELMRIAKRNCSAEEVKVLDQIKAERITDEIELAAKLGNRGAAAVDKTQKAITDTWKSGKDWINRNL